MYTIVVDEVDLPRDERVFASRLEVLGPEYDILIAFRESEWIPRAVEHIKVLIETHEATTGAVAGYILKTVTDIFKSLAIDRLKRAPDNTEELIIYGPDEKILKKITVRTDSTEEE